MKTKELIFNQAIKLFALYGYQGTTIRMICKGVGITEGSLYNHYKGKEDLLAAILVRCDEVFVRDNPTVEDRIQLADSMCLAEFLHFLVDKYISTWENDKEYMGVWQVVNNEQYKNKDAGIIVMNETSRRIERLAATFDYMQQNKKMIPCDSFQVASLFIHSIRSQHLIYIMNQSYLASEECSTDGMFQTCKLVASLYEIK